MLLVGAGSFIGGALRYLVSTVLHPVGRFPISTFVDRSPLWPFFEMFHHVEPLLSIAYNRPVWRIHHLLHVCQ